MTHEKSASTLRTREHSYILKTPALPYGQRYWTILQMCPSMRLNFDYSLFLKFLIIPGIPQYALANASVSPFLLLL